jgi:hypothetical protein
MKVAQHPGFAGGRGLAEQIAPHRDEFGAHLSVSSAPRSGRYHSSINPISTNSASVSKVGIA